MTVATPVLVQYVYDFSTLDAVPERPTSARVAARRLLSGETLKSGKSSTVGAVLSGANIICTLATQAAGSGAKAHTHPNEQFNYVLQGVMVSDIGDEKQTFARAGAIVHTPATTVHTGQACPDEDLIFFAMKDARHGIVGPPVDGRYDGPNYLPGFGAREHEPKQTTAQLMAGAGTDPEGAATRYIYDFAKLRERPGRADSARAIAPENLQLPVGVRGGLLVSERLQVAVLELAPGAVIPTHDHETEQFTLVARGDVHAYVDRAPHRVGTRCAIHAPPGVTHGIIAGTQGATLVTVQESRFPFAG